MRQRTWYESQRSGLGHDFLDSTEATFRLILDRPVQYPVLHRSTRRAFIPRFPFGVFSKSRMQISSLSRSCMRDGTHCVGVSAHNNAFKYVPACGLPTDAC